MTGGQRDKRYEVRKDAAELEGAQAAEDLRQVQGQYDTGLDDSAITSAGEVRESAKGPDYSESTSGPYISSARRGSDIELVSGATGELVATVHGLGDEGEPDWDHALQNAAMLRRAPEMRSTLEALLQGAHEPIPPAQADEVRKLLAEMDGGDREHIEKSYQDYLRWEDGIYRDYMPESASFRIKNIEIEMLPGGEQAEDERDEPEFDW